MTTNEVRIWTALKFNDAMRIYSKMPGEWLVRALSGLIHEGCTGFDEARAFAGVRGARLAALLGIAVGRDLRRKNKAKMSPALALDLLDAAGYANRRVPAGRRKAIREKLARWHAPIPSWKLNEREGGIYTGAVK